MLTRLLLVLCLAASPAMARDRVTLGWGRIFTNDGLGDLKDRWRTGSYAVSLIRGASWNGGLPGFGEVLEFRARAEVIAPEDLVSPPPGDRRYAGLLSLGVHSHFDLAGFEASAGLDLVLTGPQTGLSDVQAFIHRILDLNPPLVAANQIGNAVYPTLSAEIARDFGSGRTSIRPFAEAQVGVETFVRVGADLGFGTYGDGALLVRDTTTGQRYRAAGGVTERGWTLILGGDMARVFASELVPDGGAAVLSDTRHRLRAGVAWQGEFAHGFYGLTWLSPELDGQSEGQLVGSLNVNLRF